MPKESCSYCGKRSVFYLEEIDSYFCIECWKDNVSFCNNEEHN